MFNDSEKGKIRESTVAGIFYPDNKEELEKEIDRLLRGPAAECEGQTICAARAIVAPHAGLGYSGDLAALAWRAAAPRSIERVVVLSPLHRAEDSLVYLPEAESFSTPLGSIPVDRAVVDDLLDCGTGFSMNDIPHFEEHGVELQLPFMSRLYPHASLVPILVGRSSHALVKSLASALGIVLEEIMESTLIVLSTDLSAGSDTSLISGMGDRLIELMNRKDWEGILEIKAKDAHAACGAACIAAYLASPLAASNEACVLGRHDSSQSRQTDQERLVEYAAIAFIENGAAQ
jgi:AmmeMemoRadiSam system protein B